LTVPGPTGVNSAGMLCGADSIDDLDVLRAGATPLLFDDLRAPSTIGSSTSLAEAYTGWPQR